MLLQKLFQNDEIQALYEILELPDPKYKFKFMKPVTYFMRQTRFSDSETKVGNVFVQE